MRHDSRLSGVVHLLLHLAEAEGSVGSPVLARAMGTNAVVVRRVLGGLRDAGFVVADRGATGGWRLAVAPATLTLRDVYEALGAPPVVAVGHRQERPRCQVEQAVNDVLGRAIKAAEAQFLDSLGTLTLADLQGASRRRARERGAARHVTDMERMHA